MTNSRATLQSKQPNHTIMNPVDELHYYYSHAKTNWGEELNFPTTRKIKQYTHRLYNRYPARSISLVPRAIIQEWQVRLNRRLMVLDPFMGSGTTAIEANLQGAIPYGVEIDPFARLISNSSVCAYNRQQLKQLQNTYSTILKNWKGFDIDDTLAPKLKNVEYWFDQCNFSELLKLKKAIYNISTEDNIDFFKILLADMIRPCSKIERQTLKPYISKKYIKKPADVEDTFIKSFQNNFLAVEEYSKAVRDNWSFIKWIGNDGTAFGSHEVQVDVAVTSPPYINALDYVRCVKIESAWVDCGNDQIFTNIRKSQVGSSSRCLENINNIVMEEICEIVDQIEKTDKHRSKIVQSYFNDMFMNLISTYKALKPGGEYNLIVGNSIIKDVSVQTHSILASLGEKVGFEWIGYYWYSIKDHRTSIPRGNRGGKIKKEHVITLKKSVANELKDFTYV